MALRPGSRFGDYEIIGPLGAGGMGEVYRATDLSLGRQVAIKILSGATAPSPEQLARFDREARLLASLNHPHIGAIFGRETSGEVVGLVLELVEGPTLAERVGQPMRWGEARTLALQIIDAVSCAHESGIVHRDLKPANIKITADGSVKVLDFGLAKAADRTPSDPGVSQDATITSERTLPGTVLGTPAYMGPEQARGRDVDRRADIWAFGCILYEMLTGKRAFAGDSSSDTLAAIISRDPDWSAIPPDVPVAVRNVLRRCLAKDPQQRLRDIADARFDLAADPEVATIAAARGPALPWIIAGILVVAMVFMIVAIPRLSPDSAATQRLSFVIPQPQGVVWGGSPVEPHPTPSPNGKLIAYDSRRSEDGQRIWIHDVETGRVSPISRVTPQGPLAWAPDSGSLAFCNGDRIVRVSLSGAAPAPIDAPGCGFGLAWSKAGVLLFASATGIWRVNADGTSPQQVTIDDPAKAARLYPQWVSDNRHFVYLGRDLDPAVRGIYLGSIDGGPSVRLIAEESAPRAVQGPDGKDRVVFVRGAALVMQLVNIAARRVEGEPVVLAENLTLGQTVRDGAYGLSARLLVHRAGGGGAERTDLVVLDRVGRRIKTLDSESAIVEMSLAQDDSRLAATRLSSASNLYEIWEYELVRGGSRPLLVKPYSFLAPTWSPDGRLAFLSNETGLWKPFVLPPTGDPTPLTGDFSTFDHWSSDGQWIVGAAGARLLIVRADGNGQTIEVGRGAEGQLSPDQKWVAYRSSESGTAEIYVRPFPSIGRSVRVSRDGGYKPSWRRDGRELFYRTGNGTVMAAPMQVSGSTMNPGEPVPLFTAPFITGNTTLGLHDLIATRDGQRFIAILAKDSPATPLTVVVNWSQP